MTVGLFLFILNAAIVGASFGLSIWNAYKFSKSNFKNQKAFFEMMFWLIVLVIVV